MSSTPETEWVPAEQGWMLALDLFDRYQCGGCGGDLRDTTQHDDWVGDLPVECHRCNAIAAKQTGYHKDYEGRMHVLRWSAKRRGVRG